VTEGMDWLAEGRELGRTLDHCHAIVVVGADANATALVALGVGRVQAERRRVAVGDLIGDAPPLQSLVPADDVHGLVDSFMYGVSLNRVAYPVAGERELFVMPSGTSPIDYDELFLNPRWRRLASGFREVGALLILAVPAHAPHLRHLVDASDGAVLVGDEVPGSLSVAQSLAWIRERSSAPITVAEELPSAESSEPLPLDAMPVAELARRTPWPAWAAGIVLTLSLVGAGVWFWQRPFASDRPPRRGIAGSSPAAAAVTGGALASDSVVRAREAARDAAARDSAARAANIAVAADSFPVLAPVNTADSAGASAYAVLLENTNGLAGAILQLNDKFATLPATSYGLSLRSRLFELVAGAYPTRTGAESLLVALRARKVLPQGVGSVIALPLAFLVQANVAAADVPARLKRASARALPVYALRQPNGTANLYFGAYESPQQAALAVPAVRKAGLTPTLVYRIGRVF
jgi:hypothetical protein